MNNPYQIQPAINLLEILLKFLEEQHTPSETLRHVAGVETILILAGFLEGKFDYQTITEKKKFLFFSYTTTRKETYKEFIVRQAKLFLENKALIASNNYNKASTPQHSWGL